MTAADVTLPVPIPDRMTDYQKTHAAFQWNLPERFNFGGDVVDIWARDPDRLALIWCSETGAEERYTFRDISLQSNKVANVLQASGLTKGDRVLVVLPRIPAWQITVVACMKLGVVPIPCITMLTRKDLDYRLDHAGAKGVITTAENCGKIDPDRNLTLRLAVCAGGTVPNGWTSYEGAMDKASELFSPVPMAMDDPAILYYTSGSTGNPKGVTHGARSIYTWRGSAWYWLDLRPGDTIWCTADTGWSKAGTSILFGPWSCGAAVLFYDGPFDPSKRFGLLSKYNVSVFCAAATELRRLVNEAPPEDGLPDLRLTVSAGESVNPEIVTRWADLTGAQLLDGYGQTETLMTVLNYPSMAVKPGSMGRPLPGVDMAVLSDDGGGFAKAGEAGRLAMKLPNPQVMLGYWQEPERTAASIIHIDGSDWFVTGDRARQDADGYLFYEGRDDDVIGSAGYRIGPMEVENALIEHPAIQESAVVGSPDPDRGEIVCAYVVLNAGFEGDDALVKELQEFVKASTAPYKYPRKIVFEEDLPKTVTGKIRRRDLRDREYGRA
ncbi:acyl-CoA synthetase [Hwanghaeella sp.]|uniref:acyl-CoA synthetase n=1 Tax=Hwanghaeella sp. TaxID=2605943 RepID=UPI003CCB9838